MVLEGDEKRFRDKAELTASGEMLYRFLPCASEASLWRYVVRRGAQSVGAHMPWKS